LVFCDFRISAITADPTRTGVHPKSETGKIRTVSQQERN
jgi:hypothetical protein